VVAAAAGLACGRRRGRRCAARRRSRFPCQPKRQGLAERLLVDKQFVAMDELLQIYSFSYVLLTHTKTCQNVVVSVPL
jgi:hypothetical protein